MPNVEGVTAIAIWMLVCINFVFFALGTYAFLLWSIKYRDKKEEKRDAHSRNDINKVDCYYSR